LGRLNYQQGRLELAAENLRASLAVKAQLGQSNTMPNAFTYLWLGAVLQGQQDFGGASDALAQMMKILRATAVSDEIIGRAQVQMASLALAQNQFEQAQQYYRNAMAMMPADGVRMTLAQVGYGQLLLVLGRPSEAKPLLQAALLMRVKSYPPDHYMVAETQLLLGLVLHHQGDKIGGSELIKQGLAVLNQHPLFQFGNRRRLLDLARSTVTAYIPSLDS
jgi:Tfp pilus assembly protein PilF